MTFYLFIFIFLLISSLSDFIKMKDSYRKIFFKITIFFLFLIVGFRFQTGVDWPAYESIFIKTAQLSDIFEPYGYQRIFTSLDFGFCLLNSLIKSIGGNIYIVFAIMALLNYTFLYFGLIFFTKKYLNTALLLYFLLFFFQYDMSGIRQGVAMSIFLYSLRYVIKRNFLKYLLCLLVAFSIHWTALILIPFYFLYNISKRYSMALFLFSFIVFIFKFKWFKSIIFALRLNNRFIINKINHYTTNQSIAIEKSMTVYTIFSIITIASLFLFIYFLRNNNLFKEKKKIIIALLTFQILAFFGMHELDAIASRFSNYFLIGNVLAIISLLSFNDVLYKKIIYYFVFVFLLLVPNVPFILGFSSTIAYQPYQNYIIYELFGGKDDGYNRVEEHRLTH